MKKSAPELALERFEATTATAASPQAVLDAFHDFACGFFRFSALFVVRGGTVEGRAARGAGASAEAVMAVRLSCDPDADVASAIARALGRPPDAVKVLTPLLVHDRTVALLYADGGVLDLDAQEGALLRDAARLASRAFERLLATKKAQPPRAESARPRRPALLLGDDDEDMSDAEPLALVSPAEAEPLALVSPAEALPFDLERRIYGRTPVSVEISVGSESNFFVGITSDVSSGGVFVVTYESLEVGTHIDLEIELPSGKVRARGAVRWRRSATEHAPPGIGITFTEISDDAYRTIERFCRLRAPLYYDVDD